MKPSAPYEMKHGLGWRYTLIGGGGGGAFPHRFPPKTHNPHHHHLTKHRVCLFLLTSVYFPPVWPPNTHTHSRTHPGRNIHLCHVLWNQLPIKAIIVFIVPVTHYSNHTRAQYTFTHTHYHAATPDYTLHLTSSLTRPIEDYRYIMQCVQIRYDNKPLIAKVSFAFSMAMCSTVCVLILYWHTWINMMCKRAELEWRLSAETQIWCVLVLCAYVSVCTCKCDLLQSGWDGDLSSRITSFCHKAFLLAPGVTLCYRQNVCVALKHPHKEYEEYLCVSYCWRQCRHS